MLKAVFPLIVICFVTVTKAFADDSNEQPATAFGELKQRSIDNARHTDEAVKSTFDTLFAALQKHSPTNDAVHDTQILESLKYSQSAWRAYRDVHCESEALLNVYPAGSGLYVQELYHCLSRMNEARTAYLNDLILSIESE